MARLAIQRPPQGREGEEVSERFIGRIKRKDEECAVYICRQEYDDGVMGEEYLFFRIHTPSQSMGVGKTIKGLVRLFNIDPPMGG